MKSSYHKKKPIRWITSKGKKVLPSKLEDHHLMAALLKVESDKGKKKKYAALFKEAKKRGLPVVPPNSWHS